jgi:hypothetical protein
MNNVDLGPWLELCRAINRFADEMFGERPSALTLHFPGLVCDARFPLTFQVGPVHTPQPASAPQPARPARPVEDAPRPVRKPAGPSTSRPNGKAHGSALSDAEIAQRIEEARAAKAKELREAEDD